MGEAPDSELMDRYAAGSGAAFEELFARYERKAYAYFLRRTRSPETTWDLYQELFLRLHRFRDRYDPARPFAPWFFRIAHRVWIDELRRAHRQAALAPRGDGETAQAARAERITAAREEARELLATLSEEQARVVVLAKVAGAEYREIAAGIGKCADATKQIGSRALRKLRLAAGMR